MNSTCPGPPGQVEHQTVEAVKAAGTDPAIIYTFEKTGRLMTEQNRHLPPDSAPAESSKNPLTPADTCIYNYWAAKPNAVSHVTFTGKEEKQATVSIRDGTLQVRDGHQGGADLRVTADSETWLGFLAKERSLPWALPRRRIRTRGSPKLLAAFGKCFPS